MDFAHRAFPASRQNRTNTPFGKQQLYAASIAGRSSGSNSVMNKSQSMDYIKTKASMLNSSIDGGRRKGTTRNRTGDMSVESGEWRKKTVSHTLSRDRIVAAASTVRVQREAFHNDLVVSDGQRHRVRRRAQAFGDVARMRNLCPKVLVHYHSEPTLAVESLNGSWLEHSVRMLCKTHLAF